MTMLNGITQAYTIFCEDLRREASGQETLIGTLPDRVVVPSNVSDGSVIKIGTLTKIYFKAAEMPRHFVIRYIDSDGEEIASSEISDELISNAREKGENQPTFGIKTVFSFGMLVNQAPEYISVVVEFEEKRITAGQLYFDKAVAPKKPKRSKRAKQTRIPPVGG